MVLYFSNSLLSYLRKDIKLLFLFPVLPLNILTYRFMLGNEKTNGLITKFLSAFLHHKILLFLLLSKQISTLLYYQKCYCNYFLAY